MRSPKQLGFLPSRRNRNATTSTLDAAPARGEAPYFAAQVFGGLNQVLRRGQVSSDPGHICVRMETSRDGPGLHQKVSLRSASHLLVGSADSIARPLGPQ